MEPHYPVNNRLGDNQLLEGFGLTVLFHLLTAMPMRHPGGPHGHGFCKEQKGMNYSERHEMRKSMFELRAKIAGMSAQQRKAFMEKVLATPTEE